jgi:hypothetical protein
MKSGQLDQPVEVAEVGTNICFIAQRATQRQFTNEARKARTMPVAELMTNYRKDLALQEASGLSKLPYFITDSAVPGKLAKIENVAQFVPGTVTANSAQYG